MHDTELRTEINSSCLFSFLIFFFQAEDVDTNKDTKTGEEGGANNGDKQVRAPPPRPHRAGARNIRVVFVEQNGQHAGSWA